MKILGITLGHDTSFALIQDGIIIEVMEAERHFRQKRYKLSAINLEPGKFISGYQYTDISDLHFFIEKTAAKWGKNYDALAVQNQGRLSEYNNLLIVFEKYGFSFKEKFNVNHHLSHAALAYYTSPFSDSLILSYDGTGNDGFTIFFDGNSGNGISYLKNIDYKFGQSYNNLGYIVGIKPEVCGTSSGKTMGLTAYGNVHEDWLPYAKRYVKEFNKFTYGNFEGLNDFGKYHRVNSVALDEIPDLSEFVNEVDKIELTGLKNRFKNIIKGNQNQKELKLRGLDTQMVQDLIKTVQNAWTDEVLNLISKQRNNYKNLCLVGGCALNGITNYSIQETKWFEGIHLVPNPSDCGLSAGAGLHVYYKLTQNKFNGYGQYFSPYIGEEIFDKEDLPKLKRDYPNMDLNPDETTKILSELIWQDKIIGVIRGRYEVGPRALGNRSILCNPLNQNMRDILNEKVKHREWYRPFAPIATAEDSSKYFTNSDDIPYMSVICYTRPEYKDKLPSITHVDGSARLQTLRRDHNPFIYDVLKEFEKLSGMPILLNTSFNPGGEPILNYYKVGLDMLDNTGLDMVLIENTLFVKKGNEELLNHSNINQ